MTAFTEVILDGSNAIEGKVQDVGVIVVLKIKRRLGRPIQLSMNSVMLNHVVACNERGHVLVAHKVIVLYDQHMSDVQFQCD